MTAVDYDATRIAELSEREAAAQELASILNERLREATTELHALRAWADACPLHAGGDAVMAWAQRRPQPPGEAQA